MAGIIIGTGDTGKQTNKKSHGIYLHYSIENKR